MSLSLLLPGTGSVTPEGTVIEAVLTNVPVAAALTIPVMVYVTETLAGKLRMVVLISPLP